MDSTKYKNAMSLKGIVIDAKVVPLSKDGNKQNDKHGFLHPVPGLNTRIISKRYRHN